MRTHKHAKFHTPHQPDNLCTEENIVELVDTPRMLHALKDLNSFDRIWLVWWFHKNSSWRPLVLPPRGDAKRRGVFATRSPHRPNPIGITSVPLIKIDGLQLHVGNCDLLDGTPILDIKPYISTVDSFPEASRGWIEEVESEMNTPPRYTVSLDDSAQEQRRWLQEFWSIDFLTKAIEILSRDPTPHKTRRISKGSNNEFRIGCGGWRAFFQIVNTDVRIVRLASGYPQELLIKDGYEKIPDREALLAFMQQFQGVP